MKPAGETLRSGCPALALVGRPNVGKSTLFNRLTRSRAALVADVPGLTRDPKVGMGRIGRARYVVIDTGGVDDGQGDQLAAQVSEQALLVARHSDAVVFVVDGRAPLTAAEVTLADQLRRLNVPTVVAVNKCEGLNPEIALADFFQLGFEQMCAISASHGEGVAELVAFITATWTEHGDTAIPDIGERVRIAVVGRPNVGKSTLTNRILGEQRMITSDVPGTTRDSVDTDFERRGRRYTIVDTAGLRRKSKTEGIAEKFSAAQTLQSVANAHVAVLLVDAQAGVTEQDLSLLGLVLHAGRACVLVVNKWDGLDTDARQRVRSELDRRLRFASFVQVLSISALHGTGVGELFPLIDAVVESATRSHKTHELTTLLQTAVAQHPPPLVRGRRIKLRMAHMGGVNPPTLVVHGNQVEEIPGSYKRYLENFFREQLGLMGTPVHFEYRQSENPYAGRRNKLTQRQQTKRRRLMQHVKRR
jgi:GTP-binding protein